VRSDGAGDVGAYGRRYHPSPIEVPEQHALGGTTLVLDELRDKRSDLTASALRKRLARRFDVLDQRTPEEGGFRISINGKPLTYADRQELKKIEFIWEFGPDRLPAEVLPVGVTRFALPGVIDEERGWSVSGWFGTAKRPTDLTDDEESGSLENIIVLARKRPIQEGIVEKLDFSRIFGILRDRPGRGRLSRLRRRGVRGHRDQRSPAAHRGR
jgi:hypothetical protein